jgi:hypothetical protein
MGKGGGEGRKVEVSLRKKGRFRAAAGGARARASCPVELSSRLGPCGSEVGQRENGCSDWEVGDARAGGRVPPASRRDRTHMPCGCPRYCEHGLRCHFACQRMRLLPCLVFFGVRPTLLI